MEEDTDFKKIPVDERCVHKLWKARVDGYEEAAKIFRCIEDDKSPEWNKYLGLIKKFVTDSNAAAQEKGMEAALVFIENCGNAGKTVGEVMSGIISKCIGATRTKTRDLAIQITLMYVYIEKHEVVIEELLKGTEQKNPKIAATCVSTLTQSLREFGNKVIGVKGIVKKLATLLADRDKSVRDESKLLTIEIYRWIGPAFKTQLSAPPVLLAELEAEFEKIQVGKAVPTRYLKSQQEKQITITQSEEAIDGDDVDDQQVAEDIDPMDFIDPVDILSKLPKDFYDKLEAKKWQDRKESLDALEVLLQNPKLQPGDYGDVVRALKKVITKDSNVVLVALAGKCLAGVAKGIDKKFQPYASACVPAIFEKFKEKKSNVVTALRDAIDAIYPSTNLEVMQEDVLEALNNKNPSVKAETISFLTRAFCKTQPTILNKKLLKAYITALLKTLNEPDPTVRDVSAEAIGTLMKLIGDKAISVHLADVDPLKMAKIKECCDRAVITVKIPTAKKERPTTAPPKIAAAAPAKKKAGSAEPKPVARPATSVKKPGTAGKKPASAGGIAKSSSTSKMLPTERDMTQEEVDEKALELLLPETINGLGDANWKNRLLAVEAFTASLNDMEAAPGNSQVLIRVIYKKPGLKDTNFQVLKIKLELIKAIVEKFGVTTITTDYVLNEITEKLGDAKNSLQAAQALTAIAEAIRLEYVVSKVLEFAFEQKSPKVQQEALQWVNNAIKEFGFQVNPKLLIEDAKKGVQTINPAVRTAGIALLGTMYLYMGNTLMMFFENEKPALKQQIQTEIDKHAGEKPPPITRGVVKSASKGSMSDVGEEDEEPEPAPMVNISDLIPRVDISSQISEAFLAEMCDKNWKTRNEALIKLQNMLNESKLIKSTLGDLPQILAQRLMDSNAKIAQTALEICQQLATAMGPPCKVHVRTLFPGFLRGLGDGKAFIRSACITCINTWGDECGYKEFFESEMIGDALKSGSPALKTEVWGWLSEKLPPLPLKSVSKDELVAILPHLYANICDRNADVRKNANEAVLGIMIHIGYDAMVKAMDKQKPASKKDIQVALDKARPNLPIKPLPKNKQQAPIIEETKTVKSGGGKIPKPGTTFKTAVPPTTANRKKEEDVDISPLLAINNYKNQRLLDEQKLKVLKWTFTQPREEFTDLLKEQMQTANVNRGLMANMFHDDFRYHLKVIDSLIEDLPNNEKSLISNLDLILKWLSLRFYDTNPSVLLKSLDYLNLVFQMLVRNGHCLAENEGASFIPHLLIKIGDPKDAVRNGVRSLLRVICEVYPFTKVFIFVMDALKSKNARQRAECLDELGYLIETFKLPACQPTPQHALKEIAKHISDRDTSVRNAALNCIVQAYFLVDDKIYKYIGQMTEKDLSMLDERIKRSKRPVKPTTPVGGQAKVIQQVQEIQPEIEIMDVTTEEELPPAEEFESNPNITRPFNSPSSYLLTRPKPTGPFGLDPAVIADIEKDWVKSDQMKELIVPSVDVSYMNEPIKVLTKGSGRPYPDEKFQQLLSKKEKILNGNSLTNFNISPAQAVPPSYVRPTQRTNVVDVKLDPNLVRMIKNIGCQEVYIAHAAIIELTDILESPEKQAVLRDYEELYILNILQQFKHLSCKSFADSIVMYNPLLQSLYLFYNSKSLGKNLKINNVKSMISVLLGLLADNKLGNGDDTQHTKVVNGICLKAMDRTNFTTINCALINLLREACSNSGLPKFTDLLMKCIWRNVKVMPKRINELDYDAVLLEIHEFMTALPSSWWSNRPSDTPMRTVKTFIHNMTKIKGNAILENVKNIPSYSELHSYILKILNNLQKDNVTSKSSVQETLSGIFKLIADKESAQDGLHKLHEFKHKNRDIDIQLYIKSSKPSFQKYILDSLDELDKTVCYDEVNARTESNNNINTMNNIMVHTSTLSINSNQATINQDDKCNPEFWMDKLTSLKSKLTLVNRNENSVTGLLDNRASEENLTLNQIQPKLTLLRKDTIEQPITANRRDILQQKLDQIKQHKLN